MAKTTALELVGVALIAVGLGLVYLPLSLLWLGVCCFGISFLHQLGERQKQRVAQPPAPGQPIAHDDGGFAGERRERR